MSGKAQRRSVVRVTGEKDLQLNRRRISEIVPALEEFPRGQYWRNNKQGYRESGTRVGYSVSGSWKI